MQYTPLINVDYGHLLLGWQNSLFYRLFLTSHCLLDWVQNFILADL